MRFPFQIVRYFTTVPAGEFGLGTDGLPNSFAGQPENYAGVRPTRSNVFSARLANINGWPIQRVCVAYKYDGAGPAPLLLPVTCWVLDELSRNWYQVGGPSSLLLNQLVYFDHPILSDNQQVKSGTDAIVRREVGSLDVALVIGNAGAVDGKYSFAVGADVSSDVADVVSSVLPAQQPAGSSFTMTEYRDNTGVAFGTDPDPNVTPPAANRVKTMQRIFSGSNTMRAFPIDGTTISLAPWFYDDVAARWVQYTAAAACATSSFGTSITAPTSGGFAGAKLFMQVTANTGVTKYGWANQ